MGNSSSGTFILSDIYSFFEATKVEIMKVCCSHPQTLRLDANANKKKKSSLAGASLTDDIIILALRSCKNTSCIFSCCFHVEQQPQCDLNKKIKIQSDGGVAQQSLRLLLLCLLLLSSFFLLLFLLFFPASPPAPLLILSPSSAADSDSNDSNLVDMNSADLILYRRPLLAKQRGPILRDGQFILNTAGFTAISTALTLINISFLQHLVIFFKGSSTPNSI